MTTKVTDRITFRHGGTSANRIVLAPMQTWSGLDKGFISEATLEYYAARSETAGLLIVEDNYVSELGGPSRTPQADQQQLGFYSEAHMEGAKKIAEALKKHGNKAILQLHHAGREANYLSKLGKTAVAPSAMDFPFLDYPVRELTEDEVEMIVNDFGLAAKRAISCGYDGVEIHGANHYLLQQFFSAYSNHRHDKWGGSLENRMRFPLEVTRAVFESIRNIAPEGFIVGYRLSPEEVHGSITGYDYLDSQKLVSKLCSEFPLDYIHISLAQYNATPRSSTKTYAELYKEVLDESTKLIIVGNILNESIAEDAIKNADLIAIGRATLIDPEFGKKISAGRGDEIIEKISPEQVRTSHLTPGLINVFSDRNMQPSLPGAESIYQLHTGASLDKSIIKDGTGAAYNIAGDKLV